MLSPYIDLVDENGTIIPLTPTEKGKAITASYHSFGKVMRLTPDAMRDMIKTKFPGAEKDRIVVQTGDVLNTGTHGWRRWSIRLFLELLMVETRNTPCRG